MQQFINCPPQIIDAQCAWPEASIEEEPCLASSGTLTVYEKGGPLAQTALNFVRTSFKNEIAYAEKQGLSAIIDTRVQRLNIGEFPAVPGWHCDGVPRNSYHGQPQYELINPAAFHVCVSLSTEPSGVSNTQFVTDNIRPKLWDQEHIYRDLHNFVARISPSVTEISDGKFVKFTPKTIHRAAATHRRGWRFWFRFSMCHKPPITNTIGGNQQIYIMADENGW